MFCLQKQVHFLVGQSPSVSPNIGFQWTWNKNLNQLQDNFAM